MKYSERLLFIDMDELMTGKHDTLFRDTVHLTKDGVWFKAILVGEAILAHCRATGRCPGVDCHDR